MIKKPVMFFKNTIKKLSMSLKRFPESIILYTATALTLIYLNHAEYNQGKVNSIMTIAMIFAMAAVIFLCIRVFLERKYLLKTRVRRAIYLTAIGVIIIYYRFFLQDLSMVSISRYIALNLSLYIIFTLIPYFYKRENYELYVITLLTRFFVASLYSLILYIGMAAIIFTVKELFGLNIISQKIYFDLWLGTIGIFAPAFFLADIPGQREQFSADNYSKVLRALLLYIMIPIIIIYTAILYAFFVKIILTGQWPKGIVSNLVLWYSIAGITIIFLIYPLYSREGFVRNFVSYFPKFVILPLVMMFIAIGIRIGEYGFTENRYFLTAAGVWVAGSKVYYALSKNVRNSFIAASLAVIMILSVIGPWSSYSVSKYSQNSRFEKILIENNMLAEDGSIIPSERLPGDDKENITSILNYFLHNHELGDLRYLPENFEMKHMEEVFGFGPYYGQEHKYFAIFPSDDNELIDISEYQYYWDFSSNDKESMPSDSQLNVSYSYTDKKLIISKGKDILYEKNVADIAVKIYIKNKNSDFIKRSQLLFEDENDNIKLLYMFNHINGREENGLSVDNLDFKLFVKERNGDRI